MRKIKKILCIDGGGIRGVIPATFLLEIEDQVGRPISEIFDLIAGTSTGGIIALALSKPNEQKQPEHSVKDIIGFYEEKGPIIFKQGILNRIQTLNGLIRPKYPQRNMENVLNEYFQNTKISESLTELIIPSYDIEQENPIYFTTHFAKNRPGFDHPMKEVARATSAAPTFFSSKKRNLIDKSLSLIDGGIFANNPSMVAYAEAKRLWPDVDDRDFLLVSLGTGQHSKGILHNKAKNWGIIQWAWRSRIINIVLDSVTESAHTQILYTLPSFSNGENKITRRYFRFQTNLDKKNTAMDDGSKSNIDELKKIANKMVRDRRDELFELCELLKTTSNTK